MTLKETEERDGSASDLSSPKGGSPSLRRLSRTGWLWVIPLGLLMAGIGCVAVMAFFEPMYEARSRLEVFQAGIISPQYEPDSQQEYIDLQKAILLGTGVIEKVLTDPALASTPRILSAKDPVASLRNEIIVTSSAKNRIMDVKFRHSNPHSAAAIVDAIVDEYLRSKRVIDEMRLAVQRRNVTHALGKAETEIEAAMERVRELSLQRIKADTLVTDTPSGRIDTTYLDSLKLKRAECLSQLHVHQRRLEEARALLEHAADPEPKNLEPEAVSSQEFEAELESDWAVVAARQQLENVQQRLLKQELGSQLSESSAVSVQSKQTIDELTEYLEGVRVGRRKELSEGKTIARSDRDRQRIGALERLVEELETKHEAINEQIQMYLAELKQPHASSMELQFAEASLEEWVGIRKRIQDRLYQNQIEGENDYAVEILERANPPAEPIEKIPYQRLAAATAIGLLVSFLIWLVTRSVSFCVAGRT